MSEERPDSLLRNCVVKIHYPGNRGTGSFVAPGTILTCAHVINPAVEKGLEEVSFTWNNTEYRANLTPFIQYKKNSGLDFALLEWNEPGRPEHPCILLDDREPGLNDDLYSYGFPGNYDGDSSLFSYEGIGRKDSFDLLKLKSGQAKEGLSGAPLLNIASKTVCGIVVRSRGVDTDLGARAIPVKTIYHYFPQLKEFQSEYIRKQDNPWRKLLERNLYSVQEKLFYDSFKDAGNLEKLISPYYIPLFCSKTISLSNTRDLMSEVNGFLLSESTILVIFGDSGSGKTTFSRILALRLLMEYQKIEYQKRENRIFPVYIRLGTAVNSINEGRVIEKELEARGFSPEHTGEMKENKQLLFILDGYDELGIKKNIYLSNGLDRWNAKVILTCRKQYLEKTEDYISLFSAETPYSLPDKKSVRFLYIPPFTDDMINRYLQEYASCHEKRDWHFYKDKLESIYNLKELAANPLLLYIITTTLPSLEENSDLSRYALYSNFFDQWFEKEALRISRQGEKFEKVYFYEFARELAFLMFTGNITEVVHEETRSLFGNKKATHPFEIFFVSDDSNIRQARQGSPLQKTEDNTYRFMHKSFQEFCISMKLSLEINSEDSSSFNKKLLTSEPAVVAFLKDQEIDKEFLFSIIEKSKSCQETAIAAANAITILNAMKVPFTGLDLREIQIPGADLTGAILQNTDLSGADLQKVILKDAFISNTSFAGANLKDIYFGEIPFLEEHTGDVNCLCMNPTNTLLASGGKDDTLRLWDLKDRKQIAFQTITHSWVMTACFSPDGTVLASGHSDDRIIIWNPRDLSIVKEIKGAHAGDVNCLTFSPTGDFLMSGGKDNRVILWDANDFTTIMHVEVPDLSAGQKPVDYSDRTIRMVTALAVSPDGEFVAAGDNKGTLCMWKVEKDTLIPFHSWYTASDGINSLAFNTQGNLLAIGTDNRPFLQLWDIKKKEVKAALEGHRGGVRAVCFSKEGSLLASGSWDSTIRIWDVAGEKQVTILKGHYDWIHCLCFINNERYLASGSSDNTIRIWDMSYLKEITPEYHNSGIHFLETSDDNHLLVSGGRYTKNVRVWDLRQKKMLYRFSEKTMAEISGIRFSGNGVFLLIYGYNDKAWRNTDGSFVVTSGDTLFFYLWDLKDHKQDTITGKNHCSHITINSAQTLFTVSYMDSKSEASHRMLPVSRRNTPGGLQIIEVFVKGPQINSSKNRIWSMNNAKEIVKGAKQSIINHPAKSIVSYYDEELDTQVFYDFDKDEVLRDCALPDKGHTVRYSKDNKLVVTWQWDEKIIIRNTEEKQGERIVIDKEFKAACSQIFFSDDNRFLVKANYNDAKVLLWDINVPDPLFVFYEDNRARKGTRVSLCKISPDNSIIFCLYDDNTIILWDTKTGEISNIIETYREDNPYSIYAEGLQTIFSPSGNVMACAYSKSRSIDLFKPWIGKKLGSLEGHTNKINVMKFLSEDENILISGSEDHSFKVWDIKKQALIWTTN